MNPLRSASPWKHWIIPLVALAGALLSWLALPAEQVMVLMEEDGLVESATVVCYVAAVVYLATGLPRVQDKWITLALMVFLLMLMARELDMHSRLTGTSVLRVSYYLRGDFTTAKAIALGVIALFLLCVGYLVWEARRRRVWQQPLRDLVMAPVLAFMVTIVTAKALDRSVSILTEDFGVPVPPSVAALVVACEETLELGLPLMVMLAVALVRAPARGYDYSAAVR